MSLSHFSDLAGLCRSAPAHSRHTQAGGPL